MSARRFDATRRRLALGALLASALPVALRSRAAHAAADTGLPRELRIGIQKGDALVALRASGALEKAFAGQPIAIRWIEFVYGAPLVEAINTGDLDVGTVGSTPPILAQAGAAPDVSYVGAAPRLVSSYAIVVPPSSPVRTAAQLAGRRIAVARGSQGHLFVLQALADAHLDPSAVTFSFLAYSDARSAFERGFVDAWAVPDPRYADTELATGARTLLRIGELSVPQYGFYIAPRRFAEQHPAVLRTLFDVLAAQTRRDLAHPDDTARFLARSTGVPLPVWQRALPRLEWGASYPLGAEVIRAQQASADLAWRSKLIPRAVDVREAIVDIRA